MDKFLTNEKVFEIDFEGQPQSDSDLALIEKFTKVSVLKIQRGKITDAGMSSVGKLTNLRELWIEGGIIGDEGLAQLSGLVELEILRLVGLRFSDDGLITLQKFPKLTFLSLSGCGGITDGGIEYLAKLPNLESAILDRTGVTAEGVKKLREAKPTMVISLDK